MQIVLAFIVGLVLVGILNSKKLARPQRVPVRVRTDEHYPRR